MAKRMSIRRVAVAVCAVALAVLLAEGAASPPAKAPDGAEERLATSLSSTPFRSSKR